jgi:hypothetical protein
MPLQGIRGTLSSESQVQGGLVPCLQKEQTLEGRIQLRDFIGLHGLNEGTVENKAEMNV